MTNHEHPSKKEIYDLIVTPCLRRGDFAEPRTCPPPCTNARGAHQQSRHCVWNTGRLQRRGTLRNEKHYIHHVCLRARLQIFIFWSKPLGANNEVHWSSQSIVIISIMCVFGRICRSSICWSKALKFHMSFQSIVSNTVQFKMTYSF